MEGQRDGQRALEDSMSSRRRDILIGVGTGLGVATAFTLWVTFLRLRFGTAPFERLQASYSATVVVYYVGFALGGLIVGMLLPLRRSPAGAALLGFLFMLPMYAGFLIVNVPRAEWLNPFWIVSTLAVSAVGGTLLGLWLRSEFTGTQRSK